MRRLSGLLILLGLVLVTAALRLEVSPLSSAVDEAQVATANQVTSTVATPTYTATLSPQKVVLLPYQVVRVVDGDTIVVRKDVENITVRMIGLDTPESVDPRKPVQCFAVEASNHAKELLEGAHVELEFDPSQGTLDKYRRTLAYVRLTDGTNFALHMIANGYGHEHTYSLPYKYQVEFKAAEREARELKKGLWADAACAAQSARS